jgi:membrane-associated phospholipid phosphatase
MSIAWTEMLEWVTGLGDAALLVPSAIGIFVYFRWRRSAMSATSWAASLLLTAGATAILKLGFHACGATIPFLDVQSPSGHVSLATAFYLGIAHAASGSRRPWLRAALLLGGLGLVLAVGVSRIALHAHTAAEVAVGAAIGLVGVAWFGSRRDRAAEVDLRVVAGPFLLLAVLTHGVHVDVESTIAELSSGPRGAVPACSSSEQVASRR